MAGIDEQIDELYRLPLDEFTAARNALAKSLSGADRSRVQRQEKPTVVPWAINQLYWQARPIYERLMNSGEALRAAQVAALEGKKADVRRASESHRKALADAVDRATDLAKAHGSQPGADPLSRMLEAISIAGEPPAHPGRFTDVIQPSGFEALTGVKLAAPKRPPATRDTPTAVEARQSDQRTSVTSRRAEARRDAARQKRIKGAERIVARARAAEAKARAAYERAQAQTRAAEASLARLRQG
jgi:hypothetical protein